MRRIKIIFIVFCLLAMQSLVYAQNPTDYLILQTIGQYHSSGKGRCGNGSEIIGGADHFDEDHNVTTCRTGYYFMQQDLAVSIKVEQHTGGDSDRWLLHEVEDAYRDGDDNNGRLGLLIQATRIREINGNKIIGRRGNGYRWVSNNVVIDVSYTDLQGNKPEPLEVVQAYLVKYPSSLTITDIVFKSSEYNTKWIKDEMERRLWLCDKWNAQFQSGGVTQADLIKALVNNIQEFLNYRQKYYSVAAAADLKLLFGYQQNNDIASIQTKLSEYKIWWNANKGKSIRIKG